MMRGACEHCGNPMKEFWTTQCMYKGDWPSRRAFIRSTFDPPCAGDDYNENQRKVERSYARFLLLLCFGVFVALTYLVARH